MDLTNMIPGGAGEEKTPQQQLSKEEYAAMKKQQREEVWAEVDAQAQAVFQNGDSLKGFLDFMAQCNTQKTPNLLLIYGQNPEATVVKSYDYWKKEHRSPKSGVHGYTYMVSTEYEKDGEMRTGYAIGKGFDISQMSGKPLEERPQRSMEELIHAVLKDQPVRMQIADNLPEGIQAQYIPKQRTVYVRNGMDENTTFHAVNRELACAALDQHDGNYARKKVNAQAYCAAYVIGKRYGAEVSGFQFGKVAEMQANGQKDPQELRGFLNDVRQAAYTIRNHMERNFGEQEQTFSKDDFSFEEPPKQAPKKEKKEKEGGFWQKQPHIFGSPFYYIDYAVSRVGALEYYGKMQEDLEGAWKDYYALCSQGGSKGYHELLRIGNLSDPFKGGTIYNVLKKLNLI